MLLLDNPENVKEMLGVIKSRRRKTQYRKRKRKEWQELKKESKLNLESEDRRINLWLENMKDEVSRAKRVKYAYIYIFPIKINYFNIVIEEGN